MQFQVLYESGIPCRMGYGLASQIKFDDESIGLFLVTTWLSIGVRRGGLFPINGKGIFMGENLISEDEEFENPTDVYAYVETHLEQLFN